MQKKIPGPSGEAWTDLRAHLHFAAPTKGSFIVRHQMAMTIPKRPWERLYIGYQGNCKKGTGVDRSYNISFPYYLIDQPKQMGHRVVIL